MNIRPIHNRKDHEQALARLTALLESDPAPDSEAAAELEVLTTLIEKFEAEHFPIEAPSPVEAIRFRMDQLGLKNKDLVPYIGSASKVSEVLSGKRPLSLAMIRNLNQHLGIPAEVLIQGEQTTENEPNAEPLNPEHFPLKDMHQRSYFSNAPKRWSETKKLAPKLLKKFMKDAGVREASPAYCRSTAHHRKNRVMNDAALLAWQARVLIASRQRVTQAYIKGVVDEAFLDSVATLSVLEQGPQLAREFLEKNGIAVVIEAHLPQTYLDGAAFLREDGAPVIGLTLRYDKLDNFWFTLMHELVHVGWHLSPKCTAIFDDLSQTGDDQIEKEADAIATEALIPAADWRSAEVRKTGTAQDALRLAHRLKRHPAIVVGRLQKERNDYRILAKSVGVGHGLVRPQFPEFRS